MGQPGLMELLERAALEPEFAAAVLEDPEAAAAGYALPEAARSLLAEGGGMGLFALAGPMTEPEPDPATDPEDPFAAPMQEPVPSAPPMAQLRLLLRVMMSLEDTGADLPERHGQLFMASSLVSLTPDMDALAIPSPEVPAETLPGHRMPDDLLDIRIAPNVARSADGVLETRNHYSVIPVPRPAEADAHAAQPGAMADVEALAAAVLAAPDAEREPALLALLAALDSGPLSGACDG